MGHMITGSQGITVKKFKVLFCKIVCSVVHFGIKKLWIKKEIWYVSVFYWSILLIHYGSFFFIFHSGILMGLIGQNLTKSISKEISHIVSTRFAFHTFFLALWCHWIRSDSLRRPSRIRTRGRTQSATTSSWRGRVRELLRQQNRRPASGLRQPDTCPTSENKYNDYIIIFVNKNDSHFNYFEFVNF